MEGLPGTYVQLVDRRQFKTRSKRVTYVIIAVSLAWTLGVLRVSQTADSSRSQESLLGAFGRRHHLRPPPWRVMAENKKKTSKVQKMQYMYCLITILRVGSLEAARLRVSSHDPRSSHDYCLAA